MRAKNIARLIIFTVAIATFIAARPYPSAWAQSAPKTDASRARDVTVQGQEEGKAASAAAARAWAQVPTILKRIVPPRFAARDFDITKYGAVGDGATECTKAFQDAVAACNKAGGGRVVVPAGKFLTGAIHLKSGVNLHIAKDATILFSTDPKEYLPVVFTRYECTELMNYSPLIYAFQQENIAITGQGTIDAQAKAGVWHQWARASRDDNQRLAEMANKDLPIEQRIFGDGHRLRPNCVQPARCRNVLIEGIKIVGSPMWVLHPLYCTNVTIRGVTVEAEGPNTDGCDPDSCADVLIKDCSFSDGDDCIAIKSGRDRDGRRVNIPCQNIVIQNCVFKDGHGGVTVGSETAGGVRNVFAENCSFDSPNLDMAMRFKTNPARGGFIENCYLRNCTVKTAKVGIHMTMRYGSSGARDGDFIPVVRNIDIRDSNFGTLLDRAIFIQGYSDTAKITDVTIANCQFQNATHPSVITNAARVYLINTSGSEVSGSCSNVSVEDCEMDGPELACALRLKSNAVRGSVIQNVFMRNANAGQVADSVPQVNFLYEEGTNGICRPGARSVAMENITVAHTPRVLNVRGFPGAEISDVRIANSTFREIQMAAVVQDADARLVNCLLEPAK